MSFITHFESMVRHNSTGLALVILTTTVLMYSFLKKSKRNLPPGPKGVPILGYIPFVNSHTIHHDLWEMSKKYKSSLIHLKLGSDDVIVLNDYGSIKEVLSREDMQDRPNHFIFNLFNPNGQLTVLNGNRWKEQRGLTLRILRNLGFGKSKFEGKVHSELNYMITKINENITKNESTAIVKVQNYFGPAISNTIGLMTTGLRYDYEDEIRQNIDKIFVASDATGLGFTFFSWFAYFPKIVNLLSLIPTRAAKETKYFFTFVINYINDTVYERKKIIDSLSEFELEEENDDNFLDVYLKRMKSMETNADVKESLTIENLCGNIQAIFGAGSATTKDSLEWFLALMAVHQDVQEDVYNEIVRVLGKDKLVSWNDRSNLPITDAVIHEMLRYASMIPINLPHASSKDVKIFGYDIPKETIIMANIYAVHMSDKYWDEPEKFDYNRFLSEDKSKCVKNEHMIAFGYGRRSCPGESMAYMEILIFAVSLIHTYHVTTCDKNSTISPKMNGIGRVAHPNLHLKLTLRK